MLERADQTEAEIVVPVRCAFGPPSNRWRTGLTLLRLAERRFCGLLFQEPPRTTRREQLPLVQAEPFFGAPV